MADPLSSITGLSSGITLPPLPAIIEGSTRKRFEFVVMFVWREPVPVMTPEGALSAAAAAGGTGVARAADETGAAASQVLGAASELSRQSEHLSAEVTRFLDTVRAA